MPSFPSRAPSNVSTSSTEMMGMPATPVDSEPESEAISVGVGVGAGAGDGLGFSTGSRSQSQDGSITAKRGNNEEDSSVNVNVNVMRGGEIGGVSGEAPKKKRRVALVQVADE
jgi:hypothetical protein